MSKVSTCHDQAVDVSSVLDALRVAVVAVDGQGAPVHLNACALELLAAPSGDPDGARLRQAIRMDGADGEDVVSLALHVSRPVGVPVTVATNRGVLRRRALLSRWGTGGVVAFRGLVSGSDPGAGEAEAQLEALLAHTTDIISVLEADGTVRYSNPSAGLLTGYRAAVVNGTQVLELVHPDDRAMAEAAFEAAVARPGVTDGVVVRLRFADGSWHVVEAVVNNLLDDPSVSGLVVTVHDMTGRIDARDELVAALADVVAAGARLGDPELDRATAALQAAADRVLGGISPAR